MFKCPVSFFFFWFCWGGVHLLQDLLLCFVRMIDGGGGGSFA